MLPSTLTEVRRWRRRRRSTAPAAHSRCRIVSPAGCPCIRLHPLSDVAPVARALQLTMRGVPGTSDAHTPLAFTSLQARASTTVAPASSRSCLLTSRSKRGHCQQCGAAGAFAQQCGSTRCARTHTPPNTRSRYCCTFAPRAQVKARGPAGGRGCVAHPAQPGGLAGPDRDAGLACWLQLIKREGAQLPG